MNSRLSNLMILVGALAAFLPLLAVDYLLDNYVKGREGQHLVAELQSISDEMQKSVFAGLAAIDNVVNESPSLCTPTFIANAQKQLRAQIYLKQILVENVDGVQYCDGYQQAMQYSVLSQRLAIPGTSETLTIVRIDDAEVPNLKISKQVGDKRIVSAFVHISPRLFSGIPTEFAPADALRMRLTDGTDIVSFGDTEAFSVQESGDYVHALVVADALPVLTEVSVLFANLRANYADLDIAITFMAALMSSAFLFLAFQYVRSSRLQGLDLERAINNGELRPYYQPIMDLVSGGVIGCEVLIRWEKKGGKLVSPGVFIDYAEATGLAIPMTIKLMEQVRGDLSEICAERSDIKIGVNLFEGHFRDSSIVDDVQVIFEDSPISYSQLVFELTERRPLQDYTSTISVVGGLQALGCQLAIDDAGTGHSNLEYIQKLGADIIKIDQVFVGLISEDTQSIPVLDGLIEMASNMGVTVVAEGVENEEQALYLRERGVRQAQGFLFAPALKAEPFIALARALPQQEQSGGHLDALRQMIRTEVETLEAENAAASGSAGTEKETAA